MLLAAEAPCTLPALPHRRCCSSLAFVPWLALVALALLVAGCVVVAVKGKAASSAATELLDFVASPTSTGYPSYLSAWDASIWATVGVAGAAAAFLVFSAAVHLDQRLRKAGKYGKAAGGYDPYLFKFCTFCSYLGVLVLAGLALWAAVNCALMSAWSAQAWNLKQVRCLAWLVGVQGGSQSS